MLQPLPPAVGVDGTVYYASSMGLVALNGTTGTTRWSLAGGGTVNTPATVTNTGLVYFATAGGYVCCCNASTGDIKWNVTTAAGYAIFGAPTVDVDGNVLVGTEDDSAYRLNGGACCLLLEA